MRQDKKTDRKDQKWTGEGRRRGKMIEKEGGKHNIQTNEKKLSELHGNW